MAALRFLAVAAAVAALVGLSAATDLTVGTPGSGWQLGNNLTAWAQGQTFTQGDNLVFTYNTALHDVVEVTKANYDSCSITGAIKTYTSGNDVIPLSTVAKRYFICGTPNHCPGGMKVEIDTVAASTPAPTTPGSSPAPPTVATPPPPPSKSGANSHGLQATAAAGLGLGLGMLVIFAL